MRRTVSRLLTSAEILFRGHLLNPLWHSRRRRRAIRGRAKTEALDRYFSRWLMRGESPAGVPESSRAPGSPAGLPESPGLPGVPESPAGLPGSPGLPDAGERIFSIWLQGENAAPPLVRACFDSIRRQCRQTLVVLDEAALEREIELPAEIVRKYKSGKIGAAHYSDICRVELLHKYGGCWMDSTCFATAPIPDDVLDQDFFVYLTGNDTPYGYSFIQNCFIRARKGSYLLEAWRRMIIDYWMHENGTLDYLQHQLMFRTLVTHDNRARRCFEAMPHIDQAPTHSVWWTMRQQPYDPETFRKACSGAFFQKTAYRDASDPVPGTVMYEMIFGSAKKSVDL